MISSSLDHLPLMLGGADVSFTIEQPIPLSGIRGHRRASVEWVPAITIPRSVQNIACLWTGSGSTASQAKPEALDGTWKQPPLERQD